MLLLLLLLLLLFLNLKTSHILQKNNDQNLKLHTRVCWIFFFLEGSLLDPSRFSGTSEFSHWDPTFFGFLRYSIWVVDTVCCPVDQTKTVSCLCAIGLHMLKTLQQ